MTVGSSVQEKLTQVQRDGQPKMAFSSLRDSWPGALDCSAGLVDLGESQLFSFSLSPPQTPLSAMCQHGNQTPRTVGL